MLQPADEAKLDPLARAFRSSFGERFAHLPYDERLLTDRLIVTIPSPHAEPGAIVIYLDADEVTVAIGEYFHTHFEAYLGADPPDDEDRQWAVEQSLAFIEEFMAERTFLRDYMKGDRFTGASIISADHPDTTLSTVVPVRPDEEEPRGRRQIDYAWSGRKVPSR